MNILVLLSKLYILISVFYRPIRLIASPLAKQYALYNIIVPVQDGTEAIQP